MSEPVFCTYVHGRPDGMPFYVGKGILSRARDFSPSRRTPHHQNIVKKYGRDNIKICVFLCDGEQDAFSTERLLIKDLRTAGHALINLTDGGEGVSGRIPSEAQLAGMVKGRGKNHFQDMPEESKQHILDGLARGRSKLMASPAFIKHLETIKGIGRENFKKTHGPREIVCAECGTKAVMHSLKARCCSRPCEQRNRRKREGAAHARD